MVNTEFKSIQDIAKYYSNFFTTAERFTTKEIFIKTTDDCPQELKEIIDLVHNHKLYDDYTFKFIKQSLDCIASSDEELEADSYCYRLEYDDYTSDLTGWLHSRCDRVFYLNDVLKNRSIKDGFTLLQEAQLTEIKEVYNTVLNELTKIYNNKRQQL